MFQDLDVTLQRLLHEELPGINNLTVSFAAPDGEFATTVSPPTVNLFLYDVRENWELRNPVSPAARQDGRWVRQSPPVRVDCSYLITVWASESGENPILEEHRLLGSVMRALLRYRRLPEEYLGGELAGQEPPVRARLIQQGPLQSVGEFWQAMGGRPKVALHYTLTISVPIAEPEDVGPPVTDKVIRLRQGGIS